LPPEYCEFGGTAKKCEEWLKEKHSDLWDGLYSEGTLRPALNPEESGGIGGIGIF
jgi:hypothetical protein